MRIISIVGRKNAGKTTLTVVLAAALGQRRLRVMTIKHSHHPPDVDRHGSDSWRHFHEGQAERTLMVGPDSRVLFERSPDDDDPVALAKRYLSGADIVLVEGFKQAPLPKIEVYRPAIAESPLYDPAAPDADRWVALVTDSAQLSVDLPVLRFTDTMWPHLLATIALDQALVVGHDA